MKIQHKVSNCYQKNEERSTFSNASSEIHLDATYILLMLTQIKKCHFIKSGHSNKLCTDSITKKKTFPAGYDNISIIVVYWFLCVCNVYKYMTYCLSGFLKCYKQELEKILIM